MGVSVAQTGLELLASSNPPTSASQSAGITGMSHCARQFFVFLVEMGFHHVGQAGLELLASSNPHTLASQSVEITGMSHLVWPLLAFLILSDVALSIPSCLPHPQKFPVSPPSASPPFSFSLSPEILPGDQQVRATWPCPFARLVPVF